MLDNTSGIDNQISKDIKSLYHVTSVLRSKRKEKGIFTQMRDSLEFGMEGGDYGTVNSVTTARNIAASTIVKELLLLANTSVAYKIAMQFPDQALLRRHSPPDGRKIVSTLL